MNQINQDQKYEFYRAKRLQQNPVSIDYLDLMIKKLLMPETAWYEKGLTLVQLVVVWIFIGIRAKLLDNEIDVMKQNYEIARTGMSKQDVDNALKF